MRQTGKSIRDTLTRDEVAMLLSVSWPQHDVHERNHAILRVLLNGGPRASELCDLRWEDVRWDERVLRVHKGKRSKSRELPMNDALYGVLRRWEESASMVGPWVFSTRTGNRLLRRQVHRVVSDAGRKAGIGRAVFPHLLRATFATRLLSRGVGLFVVMELMGHENASSTQCYYRPPVGLMREAVDLL